MRFTIDLKCWKCQHIEERTYESREEFSGEEPCPRCSDGKLFRCWDGTQSQKALWKTSCPTASGGK